jgi:pimeloyl-[acyl-carrier protein] synthase
VGDAPPTARSGIHSTDPYSVYHALRQSQPLYPAPQYDRTWVLTRFADCDAVLRSSRWSSATALERKRTDDTLPTRRPLGVDGARMLAFTHTPEHTRLRRLMAKAFTPRAIERLRPRIQHLVDDILDKAAHDGELDVIQDLATVVPVTVICEILGVPSGDRHKFKPWSVEATRSFDGFIDDATTDKASAGWKNLLTYMDELIADHRANPGDDLLSALVAAEAEGDHLTTNELRVNALGMLVAGYETSTNLLGNGIYALLCHPDQLKRWHDDPSLTVSAVEELLRFDPMVQLVVRVATADIEVGGRQLHTGDNVIVLIGAANRDPARFPDPDRLDLGRNDGPHLSFSQGMHYCLGAALARLEGQIAIGSLVARFPDLRMLTSDVRYREHLVLRGLTELRVAV